MNKQKIYLLVGTPGSGKTWVATQLRSKFSHLAHDNFPRTGDYLEATKKTAAESSKPVLIETPFSVSQIIGPLKDSGFDVTPLFIIESEVTTKNRYAAREGKPIPAGHLTRIKTYIDRAKELGALSGTSDEILNHLRGIA